jgi:methionyl-tRNA formyltransferase
MKKVFFLVNKISSVNFSGVIEKYLSDCSVFIGTILPQNPEEFDLIVLWSYRKKLKHLGNKGNIILFHSSALPEGRGWAPIYNSIASGMNSYTISGIFAAEEIDAGDIIVQAKFAIKDNYIASDLRRWDAEISIMLVGLILQRMDSMPIQGKKQEGLPSFWPRRRLEENEININLQFSELIPHLRACEDDHPAFFWLGNTKYLVSVRAENAAQFPEDIEVTFY